MIASGPYATEVSASSDRADRPSIGVICSRETSRALSGGPIRTRQADHSTLRPRGEGFFLPLLREVQPMPGDPERPRVTAARLAPASNERLEETAGHPRSRRFRRRGTAGRRVPPHGPVRVAGPPPPDQPAGPRGRTTARPARPAARAEHSSLAGP